MKTVIIIIFLVIFIYYLINAIFEVIILTHKPVLDHMVSIVKKQGLENYLKYSTFDDLLRHLLIVLIVFRVLCGVISTEKITTDSGKTQYNVEIRSK